MGINHNAEAHKKKEGVQILNSTLKNTEEVGEFAKAPQLSDQEMAELLGQNRKMERINQLKNASASVFADRYGELELEGDDLEDRLAEEYRKAYNGTDSITLKSKRAKSAKKKIRAQRHLQKELNVLGEQQKINEKWFQDSISTIYVERMKDRFQTPEEKAAMRDWIVSKKANKKLYYHEFWDKVNYGLGENEKNFGPFIVHRVSDVMDNVNLLDYVYKTDDVFASSYANKYQQICQVVSAEVLLNKYIQNRNVTNINLSLWRAKIEFAKRLKDDYDARMDMMNSPYYAIVAKKDIEKYLGADGEARLNSDRKNKKLSDGLYNYVCMFRKAEDLRVFKKDVNPKDMFEKIKEQCTEESYQSSVEGAHFVLSQVKDVDLEEVKNRYEKAENPEDDTIGVRYLLDKKTDEIRAGFPEDDVDFMRTVLVDSEDKAYFGVNTINGIVADEVAKFDEEILAILEGGTVFRGQEIQQEHLPELKKLVREYVSCRREQFARSEAYMETSIIVHHIGHSIDMSNPRFIQTEEYKKAKLFLPNDGIPMELFTQLSVYKDKFNWALVGIYGYLNKNNYTISARHEKLTKEKEEQLLALEKERFLRKSKKRTDFIKISINGKEFCMYTRLPDALGKDRGDRTVINYKVDKEHEKEAEEIFKKFEAINRTEAIRDAQDLQGGDKGLLGLIYEKKLDEEIAPELKHLEELRSHMELLN